MGVEVIMLSTIQIRQIKRARAIATSGEYDEDCVRRLLQGLENELKEAAAESPFAEAINEYLAR